MPFSNEAEQAVLGAMIINREIIPDVIGIISSADFYIDRHSKLYGALIDLFNRGVEINYVTLKEQLEKMGIIDSIGGLEFVFKLMDLVPSTETGSVKHYSNICLLYTSRCV